MRALTREQRAVRSRVGVLRVARSSIAACVLLVALGASEPRARAAKWDFTATNRVFSQSIPEDVLYTELRVATATRTTAQRTSYQLHLAGFVEGRPVDELGLRFGLDSGLIDVGEQGTFADGRPVGEQAKQTLFLGETYVDLQLGENGVLELRAGKLRPDIGRGAIFNAYAFGADADLDLTLLDPDDPKSASPLKLHAKALLPDATFTSARKTSPLLDFEVAYAFGPDSELRMFVAGFFDSEDGLAPVIADAVFRGRVNQALDAAARGDTRFPPEDVRALGKRLSSAYNAGLVGYDVHTTGAAWWLGFSSKLAIDPIVISSDLIVGLGGIDSTVIPDQGLAFAVRQIPNLRARAAAAVFLLAEGPESVDLRSFFAKVNVDASLSPSVSIDGFAMLMSGERGFPRETAGKSGKYGAFISLAPLVPETQIFFNGGVASSLASPVVASIAPDGAGLIAFGSGLALSPWEIMRARASAALLFSAVASTTGERFEGVELDVELDAQVLDFLILSANAALFFPGGYFGDLPPGFQAIASASLFAAQL